MCSVEEMHAELAPIRKDVDDIKRQNRKTGWFVIGVLLTFLSSALLIGIWVGGIKKDVEHNREMLMQRTEDRFYQQDGEILEEKFKSLVHRQEFLEAQYRTIDEKLDRLIESQ